MENEFYQSAVQTNSLGTTFGTLLLRDALIPELVGTDNNILYWMGKSLARKFKVANLDNLSAFYLDANFGKLEQIKVKKDEQTFELSGPIVKKRQELGQAEFLLEAGFLAQTIQQQVGFITEAIIAKTNKNGVTLLVKSDLKDPINDEE